MLRRAPVPIALALLGFAGIASAKLAAGPQTVTAPTTITVIGTTTGTLALPTTTFGTTTAATTAAGTTTADTTTTTPPPPVGADGTSTSVLVVSGHGWGHGVGMAQWGANGYAQHGWDYRAILTHYYTGTTVTPYRARSVRVLLAEGRKRVTLSSESPWKVAGADGTTAALPAGPVRVGASLVVAGQKLTTPLVFTPGKTPLRLGKDAYRGSLTVLASGKKLQVVNTLPLEAYVLGVVGYEMPHTWPAAALEAQAVATRTYALAEIENVVTARGFDLYSDTRSQVYGGIAAESPEVTAAVRATARQVVLYHGKIATTYFSSSSGGRTVAAVDAFGKPVPYLVSVPDPYDTLSPNHDWGPVALDPRKVARALKVPGDLEALDLAPDPWGHVARVSAVGTKGSVTLTGPAVRFALGLRSTWFTVGWLSLSPPAAPVAYGDSVPVTGLDRGVAGASLEVKAGGAWQPVTAVSAGSDGSFSVGVSPTATTQYRLAAGAVHTAPVTYAVAPAVSVSAGAGTVQGTVRPALAGAAVQLQRQDGVGWHTVATAATDGAGSFAVGARLSPGSYRVRYAPGHGLSPGVSKPIQT